MEVKDRVVAKALLSATTKGEILRSRNTKLEHFLAHSLLQLLELLESELADAFDGVVFGYKGTIQGFETTANNPKKLTTEWVKTLPFIITDTINITFSLYCSLSTTDDVQFWGYTLPLSITSYEDELFVNFCNESIPIQKSLPICSKRLILRHIYFNVLDDYNNNY